jgi:cytochrome c oxidase subunit 2
MNADFQLLPDQASTMAPRVDALFWFIVAVCSFFAILIALLLIAFAVRYRRRSEDHIPAPVTGSKGLEITWSVVPFLLLLVMFFWGASIYLDVFTPPDNSLEVYVIGKQWMWQLQHPGGQREINQLHIPAGRPVKLIMTSEDVLHDFYVPAFRVKMDAVPGRYTTTWFEATKTGTYNLFCALYCGTDHSRMIGQVIVLEPADYEKWLAEKADLSLALQGRQLFQKLQCVTCHMGHAGGRAPNLEGLYRRRVALQEGAEIVADESYIRESILYPARKIRAGYRPIMPSFKGQVSEEDLIRLIAFIKALEPGGTPSRVEESTPPEVSEKEVEEREKELRERLKNKSPKRGRGE